MFIGLGIGVTPRQWRDSTAPAITSNSSASVEENATLSHSLTANETVTWSIVGGADQARFEISGSTLRWASNGTKDYEAPDDANTDNAYVVNVRATDTLGNTSDQTVTITVTNVLEVTLAALSLDDLTIAEDQTEGTKVGSIINATSGSTVTLLTQSNAGMFAKDGNDIEVGATALDFETVPSPTITLRETHPDASNSPRDTVVTITVTDVAEGQASWPLTGAGVEADWSFVGDAVFWGNEPNFDGAETDDIASLTGAAQTSFDAAVSDSTACSVTVTASGYAGGTVEIRLKEGSWVDMLVNNDGPFTQTITSGIGSGFDVRGKNTATLNTTDFDITLA